MTTREDRVREIFESEMPTVALTQYGPDGTTPLNIVRFYVCPICGSTVPVPFEDRPDWQFPEWHIEHHLHVARQDDTLDVLREQVREMVSEDWVGDHMAVVIEGAKDRRPHSRACGISQHDHGPACHRNCPTCGGSGIKASHD